MSASRGVNGMMVHIGLVFMIVFRLLLLASPAAAAANVVGTGSPESCTEAAFDAVFYSLPATGGVITFNCGPAPVTLLFSGKKEVASNITLEGAGLVTISGQNLVGLFQVFINQTLTLNQITLTRALSSAGAVENFGTLHLIHSQVTNSASTGSGGGILNSGILTVTNSVISGNSSAQYGGGIHLEGGTAEVIDSQVTGNTAFSGGGGVAAAAAAQLVVSGSQFNSNRSTDTFAQGGALLNTGASTTQVSASTFSQNNSSRGGAFSILSGEVEVSTSVIQGNWGAYGGGVRQEGGTLTLNQVLLTGNGYAPNGTKVTTGGGGLSWGNGAAKLNNVTIAHNWASYGGGFDHQNGAATLTNVTITGNQAVGSGGFDTNGGAITLNNVTIVNNAAGFFGGGIGNRGGALTLNNTLLSGNFNSETQASWNCYKAIGSTPFNLSNDFTCGFGTGRDTVDLLLVPLYDVDAFTQVYKLQENSPAIDRGSGDLCPPADQRGVTRPQGEACDIGAVEMTAADFEEPEVQFRVYLPTLNR